MSRAVIDHQVRDDILASAMIRAALCAARGLAESQACHPPGCPGHFVDANNKVGTPRLAASCDQSHIPVCAKPRIVKNHTVECAACGATDQAARERCEHWGVCDWPAEGGDEGQAHD